MITNAPTAWLLESAVPSIRYFTLTRLMELPGDDPRVQEARRAVMEAGVVPRILERQTGRGNWSRESSYYTPKYTSTHWAMLLLAELGADGSDERLRRGVDFMLGSPLPWYQKESLPRKRLDLECLYGNILYYTAYCGMQGDERARIMAEYLARCALEGGWRCPYNGKAPCSWGAVRTLRAFAEIPEPERSPAVRAAVENGLDFLLNEDRLVRGAYPTGEGKVSEYWHGLHFPLFYQSDILYVLRTLHALGALQHPGARNALEWLAGRMHADGTFQGASPFRQRTYSGVGTPEETSRWVTLQAHIVLRAA